MDDSFKYYSCFFVFILIYLIIYRNFFYIIHRKSLAVGLLELREGKFNKSSLRLEGSTNFGVLLLLDPPFGVLGVALTLELIKFLVFRIEGVGVPFEDLEVLGDGV